MRTDTERINWIENNPNYIIRSIKNKKWACITSFTQYEYNVYKTLREAIDAAMDKREAK